ncbi:tRNA (adenosine(37)-N6)-threonylcarbamoyltransferase complex ATPase subunit type 1 TsaE [Patescibacteria group bacterium]|nr:tRNA (adenosine(37)-N6)-threonylcarbamoyltransferase complex ATPase subunit type 1 TsaE [Patescibacteria group bacterium]
MALMEMTLEDLNDFAKRVVAELPQTPGGHAHVIGLSGPLGAGKTTFVQMIAKELGVTDTVPSPTFTLMRPYAITHPAFKRLIHIDAYRLSEKDAGGIDWAGYEKNPENLIIVEWPEHLGEGIADRIPTIRLAVVGEEKRAITHFA